MKKLLTIAALVAAESLSFGQGYIEVANTSLSKVSAGGASTASSATATYYFEVLIAPTTVPTLNIDNPLSGGWQDSTIMMTNTRAGLIVAANNTDDGNGAEVPSGFPTTGTANFAVVGWSAGLGPTLADALDAWNGGGWLIGDAGPDPGVQSGAISLYMGISGVALDITGAPDGGPYDNIWGPAASGEIPGMELWELPIPEPTTFGLCGLGAAALVIFRRRKRRS